MITFNFPFHIFFLYPYGLLSEIKALLLLLLIYDATIVEYNSLIFSLCFKQNISLQCNKLSLTVISVNNSSSRFL